MLYAVIGMPLFLMWASQMGTLLAQTFIFVYGNLCCLICNRQRAKKQALDRQRRQEQQMMQQQLLFQQQEAKRDRDKRREKEQKARAAAAATTEQDKLLAKLEEGRPPDGSTPTPSSKTRMLESPKMDSGLQSQQSLLPGGGGPNSSNLNLDPSVKELLTTCARYNLDHQTSRAEQSAEVLEDIRHAEAIDAIRGGGGGGSKPHSPGSPSPLPRPPTLDESDDVVINTNDTPHSTRRARLGHHHHNQSGPASSSPPPPPPYSPASGKRNNLLNAVDGAGSKSRDPSPSSPTSRYAQPNR